MSYDDNYYQEQERIQRDEEFWEAQEQQREEERHYREKEMEEDRRWEQAEDDRIQRRYEEKQRRYEREAERRNYQDDYNSGYYTQSSGRSNYTPKPREKGMSMPLFYILGVLAAVLALMNTTPASVAAGALATFLLVVKIRKGTILPRFFHTLLGFLCKVMVVLVLILVVIRLLSALL